VSDYKMTQHLASNPEVLKSAEQSLLAETVTSPQFSEDALALHFTERHKDELRYTAELGKYHRLSRTVEGGAVWERDTVLRTYDEIRQLTREESMLTDSSTKQNRLCAAATISAVEHLVRFDQRTTMTIDQWDRNNMALNTPAGLIDLENGKKLPGDPLAYCTKITACGPSSAPPDLWLRCLNTWTNGDEHLQQYLKRVCGYCLTGETSEHQFFFLHGCGRNGKSVFLNTVSGILNSYARIAAPEVFVLPKSGEKHPTALAGLVGCRVALATETEANSRWAETQLKALVAGDMIAARFMRQDFFEFRPRFKLLVSGNHRPTLSTVDEAIRARLNLLPFEVVIPAGERDTKLPTKLRAEWPGILQWMVDGCVEWQRDGLRPPECVRLATEDYMDAQDVMGQWLGECCVLGSNCRSKGDKLYGSWIKWCEEHNQYKTSQRAFLSSLQERPNIKAKHTNSGNYFLGVGLLADGGYEL
jgi:putative DNA primase/helicase